MPYTHTAPILRAVYHGDRHVRGFPFDYERDASRFMEGYRAALPDGEQESVYLRDLAEVLIRKAFSPDPDVREGFYVLIPLAVLNAAQALESAGMHLRAHLLLADALAGERGVGTAEINRLIEDYCVDKPEHKPERASHLDSQPNPAGLSLGGVLRSLADSDESAPTEPQPRPLRVLSPEFCGIHDVDDDWVMYVRTSRDLHDPRSRTTVRAALLKEADKIYRQGGAVVEAIKYLREQTGFNLSQAKCVFDQVWHERNLA